MSALPKKRYTPEEYLALERASEIKHQYLDGEIYAMSGASLEYDRIVGEVYAELLIKLRGGACDVFTGDVRVKVSPRGFFYPDVSAVCGEPQTEVDAGLQHLLNPILIVEVLSPSTDHFDRTEKFWRYQTLPSLQQYGLIAQDKPVVEVFTRQHDGRWFYAISQGLDSTAALDSTGCHLPLADIYRRIHFLTDEEADTET